MPHYMLAAHSREDGSRPPMPEEEMRSSWARIGTLEKEMKAGGAWVFSARLHDATASTVVRIQSGEVLLTDGPFAESKDHLGGFYVIEAADLDSALSWASKVAEAVGHPIEVRPFAGIAWEPGG
ncbi:MAG: YciI family protein [Chloroflexota bacterium]